MRPWEAQFSKSTVLGVGCVLRFDMPKRGIYTLTTTQMVLDRLKETYPMHVKIWMVGPYNDPDIFIPILSENPTVADLEILRLRKEGEGW